MNCLQIAWCSVTRKPVKSILLLLVVFLISLLLIAGVTSKNASIATQDSTKQAIGAGFVMEENEANRHTRIEQLSKQIGENKEGSLGGYHQAKTIVNGSENWQTWTDNSFETLKPEDIKKISAVSGISDYNITTGTTAVNPVNFSRIEDTDVDQRADVQGVSLIGNRDMSMDSNVLSGNVTLKTGRLINKNDTNVCVISEELAYKNNLKGGDKLQFNDYHDRENASVYEAEIVGIYQVKQKMSPYMHGDTYRSENVIFTDLRFPEKAEGNENDPVFAKAYFKTADVNQYDEVKKAIKKINLEWARYDLIDKNGNLDTMSSNFHNLQDMSQLLIWIVSGASFVILFLIFVFWLKNRVHEVGILLALGKSKLQIVGQILVEALMVTIIGVVLSFAAAPGVSKMTADYLVEQQVQQKKDQDVLNEGKVSKPYTEKERTITGVYTEITWQILLFDCLGILTLIITSVGISSVLILRQNLKDILTEMS